MIAYVDTSIVVKLLIAEDGTPAAQELWRSSDALVAVPLVEVEARAALAAATRARRITAAQHQATKVTLSDLLDQVSPVQLSGSLIAEAAELAEVEALRGYDAVHLAGALRTADVLASADLDLCAAAERRGLLVANPQA